jgi:uncharacterized protein (TIGR02246 family)
VSELEARVRRLEDLEAIRALVAEYRRALDEKDFEAYAELFGDDGEFVAGSWVARGRDEILAMLAEMQATGALSLVAGDDRHLVANLEIELDGDAATARSTWVYLTRGPELAMVGRYIDELRRTPAGWRFARRQAPRDIPAM